MKALARALLFAAAVAAAGASGASAAAPLPPTHTVVVIGQPDAAGRASIGAAAAFWLKVSRGRERLAVVYSAAKAICPIEAAVKGVAKGRIAFVTSKLPCYAGQSAMSATASGLRYVIVDPGVLASNAGAQDAAHELGHALGLAHSHNADGSLEYGDSWSVMGGGFASPPAPMLAHLGWVRPSAIARGQMAALLDLSTGSALVADLGGRRLWFERRSDGPAPGVMVHEDRGPQTGFAQSWLLTPMPLWPGQSWVDAASGLTLTVGAATVSLS